MEIDIKINLNEKELETLLENENGDFSKILKDIISNSVKSKVDFNKEIKRCKHHTACCITKEEEGYYNTCIKCGVKFKIINTTHTLVDTLNFKEVIHNILKYSHSIKEGSIDYNRLFYILEHGLIGDDDIEYLESEYAAARYYFVDNEPIDSQFVCKVFNLIKNPFNDQIVKAKCNNGLLINSLGFNQRLFNILYRSDINTIGELRKVLESGELAKMRLIGKKSLLEIKDKLINLK